MDELKLTFLGQAGTMLEYKGQRLVTDPHLSTFLERGATEANPWKRLYPAPTTLEALRPDGIVISHSHADHLDPWTLKPYYEAGGKAPLVVPAPEAPRAEAYCPTLTPARAWEGLTIGEFGILPVPCAHTQLHTDDQGRFRELSYEITCGGIRVFFGGDLSLYDGLEAYLATRHFDIMILPVNGADEDRTSRGIIGNVNEVQAAALAKACGAILLPMHHDLYAINGCAPEKIRAAAAEAGTRLMLLSVMQTATYTK